MIYVIDFGSQTTHLIARRLVDLGSPTKIILPENAFNEIKQLKPQGIVLSGGPSSVYEKDAPTIDRNLYELGIPILGICYGFHITSHVLGGKVISGKKEYGPSEFVVTKNNTPLLKGIKKRSTVWLSHGDEIVKIPKGFELIGLTPHVPFTAAQHTSKKIYMIQFHPEVEHSEEGNKILNNFLDIAGVKKISTIISTTSLIKHIQDTVRGNYVIGAISGGVDSTVAGTLVARAIGKRFKPIYVDNGLQRDDARLTVEKIFTKFGIKPVVADVRKEMLNKLKGETDGIKKRKIIGAFYIEVFEREMKRLMKQRSPALPANRQMGQKSQREKNASVIARNEVTKQSNTNKRLLRSTRNDDEQQNFFLLQGTIYSDVIESKGTKHASQIRVHHNVAGLPKKMNLQLLEPLRTLYKDEVRLLGKKLGLSEEFTQKQSFPGPGFAVRIRGEVTKERLDKEKQSDAIIIEELRKSGWLKKVYMSFAVMTGAYSTATKGDGKAYGEVVALRVIESKDVMSTVWTKLPYDLLQKISSRIVNEVPGISRVVYDITTKPPATMEWE